MSCCHTTAIAPARIADMSAPASMYSAGQNGRSTREVGLVLDVLALEAPTEHALSLIHISEPTRPRLI
eukprot:3634341-Rhodomonas_salina.5